MARARVLSYATAIAAALFAAAGCGNPAPQNLFGDGGASVTDRCLNVDVQDLWGTRANDLWAGTTEPKEVFHWNGRQWSHVDVPYMPGAGTAADDAWRWWAIQQVGSWHAAFDTEVSHWDGSRWSLAWHRSYTYPGGMWSASPDDVWFVGNVSRDLATATLTNPRTDIVLRWDGQQWNDVAIPTYHGDPTAVWGSGRDDVWLAVWQGVQHWDGKAWTFIPEREVGLTSQLHGTSGHDVWMIGDRGSFYGRVLHYDGNGWADLTPLPELPRQSFKPDRVWAVAPDLVWLAAKVDVEGGDVAHGTNHAALFRWDGTEWTQFDVFAQAESVTVWAAGRNDAWATRDGQLFHWDGTAWTRTCGQVG